jgi:D-3-phosphoglycerate dehydrogenase
MFKVWMDVPLHESGLTIFEEGGVQIIGYAVNPNPDQPLAEIEGADAALVGSLFPGTGETFDCMPGLKVIGRIGIGVDNVDVPAATERGICVINTPDAPTESTATFAITLMLNVARKVKLADKVICGGTWERWNLMGMELAGKTLGLAGLGRIGARVAEVACVLGMKVVAFDPFISPERAAEIGVELAPDLFAVLRAADVLSLHTPLTEQTRGMIGAAEIAQLKQGAIIINVSRGPVMDESALLEALQSGHLAGAGLDVWNPEPPAPDNPLLQMDNVIATPHIAGVTHETRLRSNPVAAEQIVMVLRGHRPPHLVNPDVWEKRKEIK